jgi:hypothetical protein
MIVGFDVNTVEAEKDENIGSNLQINYTPEIKDVERAQVNAFEEEVVQISYGFTVDYVNGDVSKASIRIDGSVLWNGDTDEIIEHWEENQELPENVNTPLMNDLYRKLLSESVGIADTLSMLPPIPTPTVGQD